MKSAAQCDRANTPIADAFIICDERSTYFNITLFSYISGA